MTKLCAFCGRHYEMETMTPLYEEGKTFILYYCEGCLSTVESNLFNLPFRALFKWGKKGQP